MRTLRIILSLIIVGLLNACTAVKFVPEEERLYTGADVKVMTTPKVSAQGKAVSACEDIIRPKPNRKFLGSRPFLWLYYKIGPLEKEKGFKHWLKTKVGEPPVYLSVTDPSLVTRAMDASLYNIGFLDSYSQFEIVESSKRRTASIKYKLFLYEPYTYKEIVIPDGKDSLSIYLSKSFRRSLLDTNDRYSLDVLLNERARLDERLKQKGFYYFNADDILFRLDTAIGGRKARLYISIKKDVPEKSKMIYRIGDVNVYPDYVLGADTSSKVKPELIDTVNYYNETAYIRPEPVIRSIFLRNNTVYDRRKHNLTLNHLNGLGVFKFVNVRIRDKDTVPGWLTTSIFLTPLPKKSLSIEIQAVSKSNNFIGPGVNFSLRNRNAFKGAEMMIYNIRTSFETQFNGLYKGQFTYEINPRVELYVPRFMVPFRINLNNNFVPRTKYVLDYSYLSRVGYFDMNSFKFTFGYKWKTKLTIDHDFSLLNINYFNIYNTSAGFSELVNTNILFRRKFEEQFIAGMGYSFFYNQQVLKRKKNQIYFNANAEVAGNTLALYKNLIAGEKATSSDPSKILGINFAQFARLDIDVRDYYNLGQKNMIASRFIAGWGLPYGNSATMPYIKQFFSGGAYSVRGFQAYSVGPGSYSPPDSLKSLFFLQQGGEIRLEANVEYRFPIFSVLRGAFFADAGNVWLNNNDPLIPGGQFSFNTFARDLAVGIGTGLRVDLDFFVLRFDLGIPARKPWLPYGQRWVFHNIDFGNAIWRRENLVFNIAFGYPF